MKRIIFIGLILLGCVGLVSAQYAEFVEDFVRVDQPHGVVVTPDGKIWVGIYGIGGMSVFPIMIYNADGSLHHSIEELTYDGNTEPLYQRCRGLSLDRDGNVLYTAWDKLWRIDYQTYEAIHRVIPEPGVTLTEAACDRNGFIYITHVVPNGKPFYIYDQNFELVGYVADEVYTIQRSLAVRPNGKDVYLGVIYNGEDNGVHQYHSRSGPGGEYYYVQSIQPQIFGECLDWGWNGLLWVGSFWDVGPNVLSGWYALDSRNNFEIVNSIGQNVGLNPAVGPIPPEADTYYSPRGLAVAPGRQYLYTADFEGRVVKKWRIINGLDKKMPPEANEPAQPREFVLGQNYPNPFNPATTIPFELPEAGTVTLKIFNALGVGICTLINGPVAAGQHVARWDGRDATGKPVSSGIYFYQLQANQFTRIKKMNLLH